MNTKDLRQLVKDPRFISGIYNYCDRWCERCAFTARCLTYAQLAPPDEDTSQLDLDNAKFWQRLAASLATAETMLREKAEEYGLDLDTPEVRAAQAEDEQHWDEALEHPLTRAAEAYAHAAHDWFEQHGAALDAAYAQLEQDDYLLGERLKDAVAVIQQYQFLIIAKLARALVQDPDFADEPYRHEEVQGTAKLVLVLLDRSLQAWLRLRALLPRQTASSQPLSGALERLRRAVEREFPDARDYLRSGHDEASTYVM